MKSTVNPARRSFVFAGAADSGRLRKNGDAFVFDAALWQLF